MGLVTAKEMLIKARKEGYAVGQFNINNLEWTKAILVAAEQSKSPVILGVSEGAAKYMGGFETVVAMVTALVNTMDVKQPVAIHLDHGTSFESCKAAIDAGFTSVTVPATGMNKSLTVFTASTVPKTASADKLDPTVLISMYTMSPNSD